VWVELNFPPSVVIICLLDPLCSSRCITRHYSKLWVSFRK